MIPIEDFTYGDYLDLERAFIRKDKRRMKEMIGTGDALSVLAELEDRFEGSGRDSDV